MLIDNQEVFDEVFTAKSQIDQIASTSINLLLKTNNTLTELINYHENEIKDFDDYENENEIIKIVNNLINEIELKINRIFIMIKGSYPRFRHFKDIIDDEQLNYEKYKTEIEKSINKSTSEILDIMKYEIQKSNDQLIKKYSKNKIIRKNFLKYCNYINNI